MLTWRALLAELQAKAPRIAQMRQQLIDTETYARCRDATWRALDAALDAESETLLSKRGGNVGGRRNF